MYLEPPGLKLIDTKANPPVCSLFVGEIDAGDGPKFRNIVQTVPVPISQGKTPAKRATIHEDWVLTVVKKLGEQGYHVKLWTKDEISAEKARALRRGSTR